MMRSGVKLVTTLSTGGGVLRITGGLPGSVSYSRTGTSARVSNAGLISFVGSDVAPITDRGLLIEPERTNSFVRSNTFETTWTRASGATATAAAADAPDGTTTAYRLKAGNVAFGGSIAAQSSIASVISQIDAISFCVKKQNHRYIGLRRNTSISGGTERVPFYDFDTDTLSNNGIAGASITRDLLGDGWVRLMLTYLATSTAGTAQLWICASDGATSGTPAGTEEVFAWNGQLELAASVGTSPIVTEASAASRGLPTITATVPSGRTKALLTYADATTTLVSDLVPDASFDIATAVLGASKGRFGASELVSLDWQA